MLFVKHLLLNIVFIFYLCILYWRKWEGVSKNEGYKRTSCFPFLEALVPDKLIDKVSIFVNYLLELFPLKIKLLLIVYLLISTIITSFSMWNIRSYLGTFGVWLSFTFRLIILITWFVWKILWFVKALSAKTTINKSKLPGKRV